MVSSHMTSPHELWLNWPGEMKMCGLGSRGATFVFLLGLTCSQSWPGPSLTILGRRDPV